MSGTAVKIEEPATSVPSQEPQAKVQTTTNLTPVTTQSMETAWNEFAAKIKPENTRIFSILTSETPRLEGDTKIVYQLSSVLQKEALQKIETRLLQYLKTALDNANVEIEFVVNENSENTKKAYTNEDKFAQMVLKNPALQTFKQQFMLDFV